MKRAKENKTEENIIQQKHTDQKRMLKGTEKIRAEQSRTENTGAESRRNREHRRS